MKAIVAFCALTAPALAMADEVGHWYVNPQFGGISVDNRRPVEDKDWLYGFGIGFMVVLVRVINPAYPEAHFYLAVTLEKTGHSPEAKPHWRAYQELAPQGEWIELAREFSE